MKKLARLFGLLLAAGMVLFFGLKNNKTYAEAEFSADLVQQESNDGSSVRYVSTMHNATDLSLIDHITVQFSLITEGKTRTASDSITTVYKSVNGFAAAGENEYYAVYTLTDILTKSGSILNCQFEYVMTNGDSYTTNKISYEIDGQYDYLYFTNTLGWEDVYAHTWNGAVSTTWPGTKMVPTGEKDGKHDVYVVALPKNTYAKVIFTNYLGNQTKEAELSSGNSQFYISDTETLAVDTKEVTSVHRHFFEVETTMINQTEKRTVKCASCQMELYSKEYYPDLSKVSDFETIYFTNTLDWEQVYAHLWNEDKVTTKWPGYAMVNTGEVEDGHAIYALNIPKNTYTKVIFNNNDQKKTSEIVMTTDNWYYSIETAGEGEYGIGAKAHDCDHNYVREILYRDSKTTTTIVCEKCGAISGEPEFSYDEKVIYFTNIYNWSSVYALVSGHENWSIPMEYSHQNSMGQNIYKAMIPENLFTQISFTYDSKGWNPQTGTVALSETNNAYYISGDTLGSYLIECTHQYRDNILATKDGYVKKSICDFCQEVQSATNMEYETDTLYFSNSGKWTSVFVHLWAGGEVQTVWPGLQMKDTGRKDSNGDEIWAVEVPRVGFTNAIFNYYDDAHKTAEITLDAENNWYNATVALGLYSCDHQYNHTKMEDSHYAKKCIWCSNVVEYPTPEFYYQVYFTNTLGWTEIYCGGYDLNGEEGHYYEMTNTGTKDGEYDVYVTYLPNTLETMSFTNFTDWSNEIDAPKVEKSYTLEDLIIKEKE